MVAERAATGGKGAWAATLLDTKGPEVRTAMLKDGKDIELVAGQEIIVFAAGDDYTSFEGYKTETETKIGCSYAKLCQSVKPGNRLLFADGSIVIEVVEIIDEKNLKGKVLNSKKLGQRKNGNLPGARRAAARALATRWAAIHRATKPPHEMQGLPNPERCVCTTQE